MSDRDGIHGDTINGDADAQGTEGFGDTQNGDDVECFDDELDSETVALLEALLRPVDPLATIHTSLLKTIVRESQTERVDQVNHTAEEEGRW